MSFEAKYRGHCGACEEPIVPGQAIASTAEKGSYVHVACPDQEPVLIFGKVCTGCWQIKALNGSCGCE